MRPKTKLMAVKFRRILEVLCLQGLQKKFWAPFHDLCVQKRSCLLWSSDAFWNFSPFKLYRKVLGAFSRFMLQKWSCLPLSSDAIWKFSACEFYRKSCGRNSTICASKNKAVCCEIQKHSGSSLLASFLKNVVAQFHDLCVQKWSCLPWNSDAFWKFSACKFYRKSCKRDSTIYASKNEAVCCEVQTLFRNSLPASFKEKVLDAIPRVVVQKRSCLPWNSDAFWKFSACKVYREISGEIFTIYVSKNEAVCCEVQTHFASFPLARLIKKLWVHFHDLCVTQTNILDFSIL